MQFCQIQEANNLRFGEFWALKIVKKIIFDICKERKYNFGKSLVAKNESEQLLFSGP